MLTTNPFDDDKLREECGVFGIWGADSASSFVALGLHALQHRGQEAAGITSFDGKHFHCPPRDGPCRRQFRPRRHHPQARRAASAIGHVRYSTTGETALRNVQPLFAELADGRLRGRAQRQYLQRDDAARARSIRRGSIFQSTSDTEVIIHLVATSTYSTLLDRLIDALEAGRGRLFAGRA